MNKPDWKDAPEWANWLAMDADGEWYWFRTKPDWAESTRTWVLQEGGDFRMVQKANPGNNSLQRRPAEKQE